MTPSRNSHSVLTNTLRSCRRARSSRTVSTSAMTISQSTSGFQNLGVRSVVSMAVGGSLHVGIVGAAAAFRRDPDDVLRRVLDVAGLAVHAVLRVDLQARRGLEVDELIDTGRAVALLRPGIDLQILQGYGRILQGQVNRLVLVVVGVGDEHRRQPVEAQHTIGLGIGNGFYRILAFQRLMVRLMVSQRPGRFAAQHYLVDADHQRAAIEPLGHPGLEVAGAVKLLVKPARAKRFGVGAKLVAAASGPDRLRCRFGGEHAALDGTVAALDARGVEESGFVAEQRAARENQFRQRLQAAGRDRARAVADALPALQKLPDRLVGLEALEFLVGRQVWVRIAEADDEADRDVAVLHVVQEGPAVSAGVERPAGAVKHETGRVALGFHLPQLLQPDAVDLRIALSLQGVLPEQLPAQMPARALGEEGVFRVQLHPGLVGPGLLAAAADAELAGGDALYALAFVEDFSRGKAGKDFNAQALGLPAEPARQVAEADDVVAVILEAGGQQEIRRPEGPRFGKEEEPVFAHRGVERRALPNRGPSGRRIS